MTYKDVITKAMERAACDKKTVFVGYNVRYGSRANGTLKNISEEQLLEMPVAENLMLGSSIGMSLAGLNPIVYFERFDFIMNAMDALVNHLDKMKQMSNGEFSPSVIIRVVVGGTAKPLFTGPTHTQDFSDAIRLIVNIPVIELTRYNVASEWDKAIRERTNVILVEYKDLYNEEVDDLK